MRYLAIGQKRGFGNNKKKNQKTWVQEHGFMAKTKNLV